MTREPRDPGATGIESPAPESSGGPEARARDAQPRFAHASEAEMARILDFYGVRWEYEPEVFPILWNLDGAVVESFAPDFHLPDFDLYLEMTTLRQKLVRKKNRKLRRLRELYPGIRIKLFYARDFRELMLKYGKFALHAALSGTSGQVVPDRPDPGVAAPAASDAAGPEPTGPEPTAATVRPATRRRRAGVTAPGTLAPTIAADIEASR